MKMKTYRLKDSNGKVFCVVADSVRMAFIKAKQITNAKTIYVL